MESPAETSNRTRTAPSDDAALRNIAEGVKAETSDASHRLRAISRWLCEFSTPFVTRLSNDGTRLKMLWVWERIASARISNFHREPLPARACSTGRLLTILPILPTQVSPRPFASRVGEWDRESCRGVPVFRVFVMWRLSTTSRQTIRVAWA